MRTIQPGHKEFELHWVTGQVMETGKNMETKVSGGGGGSYGNGYSAPVSIRSTTTVHDQIFLVDKDGKEHAFQLQDFNVACRTGNILTVLWAIPKGKQSGHYFVVHNRTTSQTFFQEKYLAALCAPNGLLFLGASIAAICLYKFLPMALAWIIAPIVIFFVIRKKNISAFKSGTDFGSFN